MVKVITLKPHAYRLKDRIVGEEYEARPGFARTLVRLGKVRYSDREAVPQREPVFMVETPPVRAKRTR